MFLQEAFAQVATHGMVEMNWVDPQIRIPDEYRKDIKYHCTNPRFAPSIKHYGLLPSKEGTHNWGVPTIFGASKRHSALDFYRWPLHFPDGKHWVLVLCFQGQRKPGKAGKKVENNQRMFAPGNIQIRFCQFVCLKGESYKDMQSVEGAKHVSQRISEIDRRIAKAHQFKLIGDGSWVRNLKVWPKRKREHKEVHDARRSKQRKVKAARREAKLATPLKPGPTDAAPS